MMLAYLIVFCFCIGVFFKPKEVTFLYCACSPIIYNFSLSEANLSISFCVLVSYLLHRGRIVSWRKNIFFWPILLLAISIILSNCFSSYPHNGLVYRNIIYLSTVFVAGRYLVDAENLYLNRCIRIIKVLTIIVFFNSLIELITLRNPFNELMLSLGVYNRSNVATYIEFRYGLKRCQSVFGMKTTLGGFGLMMFGVFTYLKYVGKVKIDYKYLLMAGGMGLFSGTRAVIIGFIVMFLGFGSKKIRNELSALQMTVGSLILLCFLGNYLLDVLHSLTSTDSINGSNSEMRRIQLDLSLYYMMKSPIWGNGLSFSWTHVVAKYAKEALGLESCWFPIMIDRGIFGCLTYASFYLIGCLKSFKDNGLFIIFIYASWLVANSMSSFPGLNEVFYMPLFILLYSVGRKNARYTFEASREFPNSGVR